MKAHAGTPLAASEPLVGSQDEILTTAGSYGDILRFLETFPGVQEASDSSNDMMVRGGQPLENLYLVDGIEVPNLNHLATLGTTGGFAPMVDAGVVRSVEFESGGYDVSYSQRLSSVTQVHLLSPRPAGRAEAELGIEGAGGLTDFHVAGGDLLVSAHHGLLNLVTNDIGMNGVPNYTNELSRYRRDGASGNHLSILNIAGWDSMAVNPCPNDPEETTHIDTRYAGWRETSGLEWQRGFSARSFGVLTLSDSEQREDIGQFDQLIDPLNLPSPTSGCHPVQPPTPVYLEHSGSPESIAGYRFAAGGQRTSVSAGFSMRSERPAYEIQQPTGAFSPYSVAPVRQDATSFSTRISTFETGSFAEVSTQPLGALFVTGGVRLQTFAFGSHRTITPYVSARLPLGGPLWFHATYAQYAQLPPYVNLLSYPVNHELRPMRATHEIAGVDFKPSDGIELHVEAYRKVYSSMPAPTEYPTMTLQQTPDMLGQQFIWLPMISTGRGQSSGIEVSSSLALGSRATVRGSVAYARSKMAGLDGVYRPGNTICHGLRTRHPRCGLVEDSGCQAALDLRAAGPTHRLI